MTNAKFQQMLQDTYKKSSFLNNRTQKTVNELVYALRMDGMLTGINWQINIETQNGCTCIPGVMDSFIPVKNLAQKVVSVEFDEETYEDFGVYLVLLEVED